MNKKTKSSLVDTLVGLIVFAISVLTFSHFDSLLAFYLIATFSIFLASVYRGASKTLHPYLTFCLVNVGMVFLILDISIKSDYTYSLTYIPILLMSGVGIYLGRNWASLSLVQRMTAFSVSSLVVCLFYISIINSISNIIFTKSVNDDFPAFDIPLPNGEVINTDSLKGKVIVLNFGMLNDTRSNNNLMRMEKVFKQFAVHPEVEQFFLSTAYVGESSKNLISRTKKYLDMNKIETPFSYNFESSHHYFRTYILPTIVIIDKKGKVRIKRAGYFSERDVAEQTIKNVQSLLAD